MERADLLANEQVHVWNITNGSRFVTYAIEGERDAARCASGPAALLAGEGDRVIVASFAAYDDRDLEVHAPVVVHVDAENRIASVERTRR